MFEIAYPQHISLTENNILLSTINGNNYHMFLVFIIPKQYCHFI